MIIPAHAGLQDRRFEADRLLAKTKDLASPIAQRFCLSPPQGGTIAIPRPKADLNPIRARTLRLQSQLPSHGSLSCTPAHRGEGRCLIGGAEVCGLGDEPPSQGGMKRRAQSCFPGQNDPGRRPKLLGEARSGEAGAIDPVNRLQGRTSGRSKKSYPPPQTLPYNPSCLLTEAWRAHRLTGKGDEGRCLAGGAEVRHWVMNPQDRGGMIAARAVDSMFSRTSVPGRRPKLQDHRAGGPRIAIPFRRCDALTARLPTVET